MNKKSFLNWVQSVGINNIVWITDLDHTVLDMKKDAAKVIAEPGLEESFHRLDVATEGRFYIVTGRELGYVDEIFPKILLKASTEYHSVARWENNAEAEALHTKPQWDLIDSKLQDLIDKHWPEIFIPRDKPFMRSLHYRGMIGDQKIAFREKVTKELDIILNDYYEKTEQRLVNIDGGSVFDIAPEGASKGPAIEDILERVRYAFPQRYLIPVYFGDSPGDLPAAKTVQARGGKFISVGDDKRMTEIADFQLDSTGECREVFEKVSQFPPKPKPERQPAFV